MSLKSLALRASFMAIAAAMHASAVAQDASTSVEAFNVPVFESVDENGVDLITGSLRVASPVMVNGSEAYRRTLGLQWVGKAWTIIEHPSIWRDGDKYIVNYRGRSEEFNDRSRNYSQRKPIMGSSLTCSIFEPGNLASECIYTDRDGDVVHFKGRRNPLVSYFPNYGQSSYAWGNIGMAEAFVVSEDRISPRYGYVFTLSGATGPVGLNPDSEYYKAVKILDLGNQQISITTGNHSNDTDEHYLRPKNTVQTFTDSVGSTWRYTFNLDRRMTRIEPPAGGSVVTISYNNGKVDRVTNASGTWSYAYTTPGDYGTTTITSPLGKQTYVKYHRDRGYVTESRDELNNYTYYRYDTGHRLDRITYPEQDYVEFTYDGRGNVIKKVTGPKPAIGGAPIEETAFYDATCTDRVICNKPRYIVDGRGNRTDFEYQPSRPSSLTWWSIGGLFPIQVGTGKPVTITSPQPELGRPRPQVRNIYANGLLTSSSICMTTENCVGGLDEVVTTYHWGSGSSESTFKLLFGKAISSQGRTIWSCYGYDSNGRRVSETPPIAGLTSCPASISAAPAVNATMPSVGTPAAAPTFPDGVSSPDPTPDPNPPVDNCGFGGVICQ